MLWGGRKLAHWLQQGGTPERNGTLASQWRALSFDACAGLQSRLPEPPPLTESPIFILGLWRTGTTLLHELIASLSGHAAPTTWQCFHPASFRLTQPPAARVSAIRPMDQLEVTNSSPQEDEFALLLMGAPSLYRGFLDPRRLPEVASLLRHDPPANWERALMTFLRGVAERTPGRLVVKSPNHLFRAEALRRILPDAPMILTLRDPAETWASNLRTWNALIELHGLWAPPAGAVEHFLNDAMMAAADALDRLAQSALPVAVCRFEDLAKDPAQQVSRLLLEIGVPVSATSKDRLEGLVRDRGHIRPLTAASQAPLQAQQAIRRLSEAQRQFGLSGLPGNSGHQV